MVDSLKLQATRCHSVSDKAKQKVPNEMKYDSASVWPSILGSHKFWPRNIIQHLCFSSHAFNMILVRRP